MSTEERTPDAEGFTSLWPTLFLKRRLPGHEAVNQALLKAIEDLEAQNKGLTTDYRDINFLGLDHPAAEWLRDCANKTAIDYLKRIGMTYPINWTLQGWANVNRFGDYHDPHNHPHAYLSGTYYVRVPKDHEALETRGDVRPGHISFYDPRGTVNMTAIRGDPQIEAEYTVRPEAGEILLWPAFLYHFVHPNLSREPRVSVSFNVVLKWSDDYLPRQD